MPGKRIKSEAQIDDPPNSTKSMKTRLAEKPKKKQVTMPSKRRGEGTKPVSKTEVQSSIDDETKVLLNMAREAMAPEDILSKDDSVLLDMLLDEEYSTGLIEDILNTKQTVSPQSTEPKYNQADDEIEVILDDIMSEETSLSVPLPETPDEDHNVTEGLEPDFLFRQESMEDPFYCEPFIEQPRDPDSWECEVAVELAEKISPEWEVYVSKGAVKLVLLSCYENVSVERCIFWNGTKVKIFVHNKEIPEDNFIRQCSLPQTESDVCDFLVKIAHLVISSSICQGVRIYKEEWIKALENAEGCHDPKFYQDLECFRDKECMLLITDSEACEACHQRKAIFRNRNWRRKHTGKDQGKTNIRYMSSDQKNEKLMSVIEKNKALRKRVYNLKLSLEKFIKKGSIEVGNLGQDLSKIFKQNTLSKTQKIFGGQQVKAHSRQNDLRGMRWNPFMIRLALRIQMLAGKEAYDSLRQVIYLPSQRRLFDFSHFIEAKEGIQEEILDDIEKDVKNSCKKEYEKYYSLLIDEMDIRSDIVISRKTGEIIGFQNLLPVEKEMERLEKEMAEGKEFQPTPAKKISVFMIQGLCNSIKEVVSIYTTSGALTASQLYSRFWRSVSSCENRNLKILCAIADGASVNKKFFSMHTPFEDPDLNEESHPPKKDFTYCTRNISCADEWRPLFFIVDPPHLLKTLRNCFANSCAHKKTRLMWKNGENISWTTIEALYAIALKCKYTGTKLTKSHVKLTAHSCMEVIYAAQVMSMSVAEALDFFKNHDKLNNVPTNELRTMITLVNNWFDCHNGGDDNSSKRTQENPFLGKYADINDFRFLYLTDTVLKFFQDWKDDTLKRSGRFKSEERERMFISHQSYESLNITISGFTETVKYLLRAEAPYVIARHCNSDSLDQYFGKMRMAFGANKNPSASQAIQKVLTLHQQQGVALSSKKGNTEVTSEDYVPNEEKLRQRKK